jgi:TfoX/Sxy family transcriptional regulator of competence genes
MPAFTKAPPEVIATFESAIESLQGIERRTMFGYPSAFLNGNMFGCVFQDRIMVRLDESDRQAALALPGAQLFAPSPGRAMREYVELPPAIAADAKALSAWFERARAFAAAMPAKKKKPGR